MDENTEMDVFVLNDGNRLPAVGLGTSRIKPEEMDDVINNAMDTGYRHFDSAQMYKNAAVFGKALSKVMSSKKIKREDIFVTTKLAFHHNRPEDVRSTMMECLENLRLDYVDLFLIHHPVGLKRETFNLYKGDNDFSRFHEVADHIAIWKEMEKLVEDKLTRSIGVSNFNKDQLTNLLQNPQTKIQPAVLQIECHVSLQEKDIVKFCHDNNIVVTGYAALGSPNLILHNFSGSDMVKDEALCNMAKCYKRSTAQVLLRFLIQRRVGVIVKSSNAARLKENIELFDFELSKEDFDELSRLDRGERIFKYPFQIHHPQNPYPDAVC